MKGPIFLWLHRKANSLVNQKTFPVINEACIAKGVKTGLAEKFVGGPIDLECPRHLAGCRTAAPPPWLQASFKLILKSHFARCEFGCGTRSWLAIGSRSQFICVEATLSSDFIFNSRRHNKMSILEIRSKFIDNSIECIRGADH